MSQRRELNPRPLPYQGSALPLSYIGQKLSGKRDSNSQHSAWKADALPIELFPLILSILAILNKKPRKAKEFFNSYKISERKNKKMWEEQDSNLRR